MYKYRIASGKTYRVSRAKLEKFNKEFPNAVLISQPSESQLRTQTFVVEGKRYQVKDTEWEGFKRKFGNKIETLEMFGDRQEKLKEQRRQAKLLEGDSFTLTSWDGFVDWWQIDETETQEENSWYETLFGKNQFSDLIGDLNPLGGRAARKGWAQGSDVTELGLLFNVKDRELTEKEEKTLFEAMERQANQAVSDEMLVYMNTLPSSSNGTFNMMNAISGMSPSLVAETLMTSIVGMGRGLFEKEGMAWTAAGGGIGALTGAGVGVGFGGVGVVPGTIYGAVTGAYGGISGAMEATGKVGELIRGEMDALGMEFTYENFQKFSDENPEKLKEIRTKAITKGVTVGAIESLFGAILRPLSGVSKTAFAVGKVFSKPLVRTGAAFLVEGTGGALGEYASQKVIGEEASVKEVTLEAIGGGPISAVSAYNQIMNPGTYEINGVKYEGKNRGKGREEVWSILSDKNLTDKEIVEMDLNVENDPVLEAEIEARNIAYEKLSALPKDKNGNDIISLEDRENLLKLEVALEEGQNKKATLVEVGGKLISLLDLKQQIKDIYGKYEGKTKQDLRVGDVKTAVDVRKDLLADEKQTKSGQEAVGLDYQNFDFTEQFEDAYFEKYLADLGNKIDVGSMTEQQLLDMRDELFLGKKNKKGKRVGGAKGVEGINFDDGTIFVDKQRAVETRTYKSVNSHEFLHNVVDNRFESLPIDKRKTLIKDFQKVLKSKLSKKNYNNIVNRLKRNGDDLETSTEWFTYLSDEIKNTKNFKEKSKGFLNSLLPFLNKSINKNTEYKNLDLENADNVYEFLKDYATNVEGRKKLKAKARDTETTRFSRSGAVDAVNEMEQGVETKAEFQRPGIFNNIYNSITQNGGAINNYVKSLGLSKEKFQETIDSLSDRLMNYDPAAKRKTDTGEKITIGEFLMSNVAFAKLDAAKKLAIEGKRKSQEKSTDIGATTKEGEVKMQVEDTDTSAQQALDEQDMSVEGIAKTKQDKAKAKEKQYSKFRKQLGIETGSDLYNKVIETAKKSLLRAYEVGTSVRNIQRKLRDEASVYLFKDIKNFLGTKEYIKNITEYREFIVNAIFTADLVQLEKMVPDGEKIFTVFDRELTAKADVEAAVEQNLLPKEALKVIDKGNAVRLYRKVMPTEKQFIKFFDQPAINPKTGLKSGLKGTRKDALTKAMAGSLSFDAMMEVAQDPEVAETRQDIAELKGESLAQDDIQQLASAIGRNPDIKFSMSNVDKNILDHIYELVQDISVRKTRKLEDVVSSKDGKDFLKIDIKRKKAYKAQNRNIAIDDKNFIAKTVKDIVISNQYGKLTDPKLEKQYMKNIIAEKNKSLKMGDIHENTFRNQFIGLLKKINTKVQSVKAKGDVYFSNGITKLGIEIKLNLARGISQTINFVKGKAVFANKNETVSHRDESTTYDDEIGALTEEQYGLVERLFIDNNFKQKDGNPGIADNQILTEEQAELLKNVKSLFTSRITMNNTDYISWGYANGKYALAVQGMIEIGQSMFNLNNSKISNDVVSDYNFKNSNDQIKGLKLKDGKEITMISYVQISKNNKLTFRMAPLLNDTDFVSSSNVRTKGNSKILANSIDNSLTNFSESQTVDNINKSINFSKSSKNPTKGISILDFDDTLATSSSLIKFTRPDDTKGTLTPEQYASTYEDLLGLDYKFDFSEFNKVVDGKPAPLLNKAKKLASKFGTDNMFILTARPQESALAIQKFLKENGLDIPLKNITGLGNSTADAKALWVLDKAAEGYNDFYFADDAIQNVEAVQNMLDQIDVKSKVQQAIPDIIKQKVKFSKSSLKNTINSPQYKKFRNNIKNRVLYHGGSETINTIRDNNAVWFYLDDIEAAQLWGDGEVYSVKVSDIQDTVVLPDLNDVGMFTNHIQEKFNLKEKIYDIREILKHPKADEILTEWMDWSSKNDMTWDIGYNLYEKGNVTNGAAVTVLGVIPKNKIQQVSPKFSKSSLRGNKAVNNLLSQIDVKSKVQLARVKFSKSIDGEFNGILERISGIGSEKRFSAAQAKLRGNKGRYKGLVPASAQDFLGLLYNFIGKGKKGDADMAFFKKALIDPFARGIDELNASRQAAANDYKILTKQFPNVKKKLNKKVADTGFTNDQAIRVYLWNKAGFDVPGLTQRDLNTLDSIIKNDPELQAFADTLGIISKKQDGYSKPGEYWLVENIASDLLSDGAIGDARVEFLAEWKQNADQIFSLENLNKIEAIYGSKFKEALKDILTRMETGRNRPGGGNRLMNTYMNWVNNSVGAIMFFNIRSAVLQTISATNYINFSFNNPLKAAQAFANQKQYWSDFTTLFNSDYLKQRRSGNRRGVNEADLSAAVAGSENKAKAALAWLLSKGFLPTQIADSFAIASGGASFYRNSIKKYMKEGMTKAQAEQQAFIDFQETTEVAQQSARPDMISQQQANPLGRLILSFQNTPMQYGRIMNKAFRDIANGRGDTKTHMSKIIYYGGIQAIIFGALQSALFASLGDDEEEDFDKKKERIINGMIGSWLSTFGYGGKAVDTIKGTVQEFLKQKDKGWNADHAYTLLRVLSFSPPIGSKLRKIYSAIQTDKFNEDVYGKRGFTLDNPIWNAFGSVIEGFTNVPLGRIANKMLNLDNAMDSNNQWWERVALIMGWNTWDLGIKDKDIEEAKKEIKKEKKTKTKKTKDKKTKDKKQEIENKEKENKKKKDGNCIAISTSGNRCKNKAESGGYCTIHAKVDQGTKEVQCKKVKSDKKRCKMKTKAKSGYCYYHD